MITPLTTSKLQTLKAGDIIELSGTIYTGRDLAHKRLVDSLTENKPLPFEMANATIFYTGPTPTKPGDVIGSCGPTTSYRMDDLTIPLLKAGLKGMIGKGERSPEVIDAIKDHGATYFISIGGVAALTSNSITAAEVIAYPDLGTEACRKLEVTDLKLIVAIDSNGQTIFENYKNYARNNHE
jgi:fumarate hydratase subunit beta